MSSEVQEISDWAIQEILLGTTIDKLLKGMCDRLGGSGIPVSRAHIACSFLHPLFRAFTVTWSRDGGLTRDRFHHGPAQAEAWGESPLKHVIDNDLREVRFRLADNEGVDAFPVLREFVEQGHTDYLLFMTPFTRSVEVAKEVGDGCFMTFCTDRPSGFTTECVEALRRLFPRLAVGLKSIVREQTTQNITSAYLGSHAGDRVLHGQIKLGDGDLLSSVIWFSDMRGSTELADRMAPELFLKRLNRYFECTAGAVLDHGGEVLRFIGDAVLAIFPIAGPGGEERAARMALSAAREAIARCERMNAATLAEDKQEPIQFGLGLHVGELLYGNIGVPERIEFSVIGAAANESARLEGLTKKLGRRVVASDAFASLVNAEWEPLGSHRLRGVAEPQPVYALVE